MTDPLPETRSAPLSPSELARALDHTDGDSRTAAALLLALPLGELPVVSAKLEHECWHWRGAKVEWSGDVVHDVVALVESGRREGDRFLVPEGEPWRWVRPTRSGYKTIVWGADTLLGAPALSADPDVSLDEIWAVLRAWWHGELTEAPAVYAHEGASVLVTGDDQAWHLVGPQREPAAPLDERSYALRALELCIRLSRSLGAMQIISDPAEETPWGTRTTLRGVVDGYRIEIPVTFSPTSTLLGATPTTLRTVAASGPSGFEVLGTDSDERIVCRAPDGTWVRLVS